MQCVCARRVERSPFGTRSGEAVDVGLDNSFVEGWSLAYQMDFLRSVLYTAVSVLVSINILQDYVPCECEPPSLDRLH